MIRTLSIIFIVITAIHGLIHLMGFVAYWPLAKLDQIPYKTSLLGGRLEIGASGMRAYSLLWLLAALGFAGATVALAMGRAAWAPLMLAAVILSIGVCILDWGVALRGVWIDVALLLALGIVFGLRVPPANFPVYASAAGVVETMSLPSGLSAPVERFYRLTYGEQIPVYHSAVIDARGTLRFMGITFPARARFTHIVGQGYRHYLECTFYGFSVFKVNERYLDGHLWMQLPVGTIENDARYDGAANQGLWAESAWYPASYLVDPRVRWEAVDEATAKLYVPLGDGEQVFTVHFDLHSRDLGGMETIRFSDSKRGTMRWTTRTALGETIGMTPGVKYNTATWEDEGTPWLVMHLERAVYNSDVNSYIRQTGP